MIGVEWLPMSIAYITSIIVIDFRMKLAVCSVLVYSCTSHTILVLALDKF